MVRSWKYEPWSGDEKFRGRSLEADAKPKDISRGPTKRGRVEERRSVRLF